MSTAGSVAAIDRAVRVELVVAIAAITGLVDRLVDVVAQVAGGLADVVAGVADLVGEVLAVTLAPRLLRGLFGFAHPLLDVVHEVAPPSVEPVARAGAVTTSNLGPRP